MHSFDFDRFARLPAVQGEAVGTLAVPRRPPAVHEGAPLGNESAWAAGELRALRALCREGARQAARPVLELDGLLPLQDALLLLDLLHGRAQSIADLP